MKIGHNIVKIAFWLVKIGILNFDKNFIELANIEEYFAAICRI